MLVLAEPLTPGRTFKSNFLPQNLGLSLENGADSTSLSTHYLELL